MILMLLLYTLDVKSYRMFPWYIIVGLLVAGVFTFAIYAFRAPRNDFDIVTVSAGPGEFVALGSFAVFAVGLIFAFGFFFATISGGSMEPTLSDGDRIVVAADRKIRRFDVIVFKTEEAGVASGNKYLIKRVIALPGETIKITGGVIYIDGAVLQTSFPPRGELPEVTEITLSGDSQLYFVMGDNQPYSHDSAEFGPIKRQQILGTVTRKLNKFRLEKIGG